MVREVQIVLKENVDIHTYIPTYTRTYVRTYVRVLCI